MTLILFPRGQLLGELEWQATSLTSTRHRPYMLMFEVGHRSRLVLSPLTVLHLVHGI